MIPPIRRGRTFSRPAGGTAIPEPTLIRPLRGHLPPGRGKAFGRLIVVPTVYPEAIFSLSQGPGPDRPAKYREIPGIRREGHTPGWPHLGLRAAAFRRLASKCACGRDLAPAGQFTFSPSPTNRKKTLRVWVGEPLGAPAGGKPRGHPHPPPSGAPSPFKGEGLRATARVAPTAYSAPVPLARQSQAQSWNRIDPEFLQTQGPSGPGRNRKRPLRFCAPEIFCLTQGITPVMGDRG